MSATTKRHKPIIGLLGGVGSGKSRVALALGEMGAKVIDADRLGHEALCRPDVRRQVLARWGEAIEGDDGQIDRDRLGQVVFEKREELDALTRIVWPAIAEGVRDEIAEGQSNPQHRAIVLDAAVLLEAGWRDVCDRYIFVDVPEDARRQRVHAERGWNEDEWRRREQMQMSVEGKRKQAHYVLDNGGDWPATVAQLRRIFAEILD